MIWGGHVARCIQGFGGKFRKKEPPGRPRRRWENRIRMDIREIGWGCRVDPVGSE
jgi:hypothetical protein